ncbi:hypothetical protein Aspvir_006026 [Aspergillus viridinutans]|uniref:Xylanolytic transcriptional activator regulatory domain-containing protein n=1 Tax=Aspergillus viridinutans TaxID=75553 RepID=A0A9P3BWN5_ASPVI|nr:uncharacterized protein Aspvir_006026 [Aspergillus viridinutans]GIK01983.1 hypothetical protein Aspvir_006026 [Aspergillus viridinutans]
MTFYLYPTFSDDDCDGFRDKQATLVRVLCEQGAPPGIAKCLQNPRQKWLASPVIFAESNAIEPRTRRASTVEWLDGNASRSSRDVENTSVPALKTIEAPRESTGPDAGQIGTTWEEACESGQPRSPAFINRASDPGRGNEVVYYGDSFNLNYVLREMVNPFQGDFDSSSLKLGIEELYLNHLGQSTKDQLDAHERSERSRLREMGAFQRLDKEISDALIQTIFAVVYSLCPTFDLSEFDTKYKAGKISALVLQALYFVAAAHCELSSIEKAGFSSRYMATFTFYQRAKALYDANYESDAIATVQASYLLSYWWGSPLEQKDMWHWTGLAVGLAQFLGLHQR